MVPTAIDPERGRRMVGLVLYVLGTVVGGVLLQAVFLVPPLFGNTPITAYTAMATGAALAFPAVLVYMTVPRLLDRYDPEPAWALALAFTWGALGACGFSAPINSVVSAVAGEAVGAAVCAPLVEEFFKGLSLFGIFYFWRREFDGVIDGIIYATFAALGFAAVENVIYYARAGVGHGTVDLTSIFILRGVVTPWAHPLFTSMTGIGFCLSRESTGAWARWLYPLLGYGAAVLLHGIWNGAAVLSAAMEVPLVLLLLPLWFLFVLGFLAMVFALVLRRGRIIRDHLQDEVLIGTISRDELALVGSAFGQFRARSGPQGRLRGELIAAAARLALSKWHATRAMKGQMRTISFDFIAPLRERIHHIRAELARGAR
jgi:RsiW-degrading membrane proteinase PrsW (M82 family)